MSYATLQDLIQRADGDEIVQRGLSDLRLRYRQAVAQAADLADIISGPTADDVALAEDDDLLYRYSGESWSAIAAPKITRALEDASALADDHLRSRHVLPLAGVPRTLVFAVCDIARYYLYDDKPTEIVAERHRLALAWLKSLAAGSVVLDGTQAPVVEGAPGQVTLQLKFTADSWVEVFDGSGKAVLYDLGKSGSERTIAAAPPLSVTLGNAPAVTIVVNGRAVPRPPTQGTLARFSVGADGMLH